MTEGDGKDTRNGDNSGKELMDMVLNYFSEYMDKYVKDTGKSDDDLIAGYIAIQTLANVLRRNTESKLSPSFMSKMNKVIEDLTEDIIARSQRNKEKGGNEGDEVKGGNS